MSGPVDPSSRSSPPPIAQFLAEAALQRQTSLLGLDKKPAVAPPPFPVADAGGPPPQAASLPLPAAGLPAALDKASISAQAREQLAAGFAGPRPGGAADGDTRAAQSQGTQRTAIPSGLGGGASDGRAATAAAPAAGAASGGGAVAWPAAGLGAPLLRMVASLVAQVTAQAGVPQRVIAAQPWPVGLAQAMESGALDADQPPLQAWLVRQGVVQTAEGPRGMALTLRAPVPWVASHALPAAGVALPAGAGGALQVPFAGGAQGLQSGVMALVLQGMDAAAPRTSALLVLDLQPQMAAAVYGRDLLQQAASGRLDPWTQMAVLQASGQVPREEERARNGASGLCDSAGCPYVGRAACVQPFCLALRGPLAVVAPADRAGPSPAA